MDRTLIEELENVSKLEIERGNGYIGTVVNRAIERIKQLERVEKNLTYIIHRYEREGMLTPFGTAGDI